MDVNKQLKEISRGSVNFLGEEDLRNKLEAGKRLNVKFGVDPTAPDIHLGHTVPLQKLKFFQDEGHNITLVIGDYTAKIGDPSGKSETRPILTENQIKHNLKTYTSQVFKILDRNKTNLVYNSKWLANFKLDDILQLASKSTVQQLLQRRDFSNRIKDGRPLTLTEMLYPLLVGYDSVVLETDVELGGTDQLYNFVASRNVQAGYGQIPESVLTLQLLEGTDGIKKMSKSLGNAIGVTENANSMYGKIMSIDDNLMVKYFELISEVNIKELDKIRKVVKGQYEGNPMLFKQQLATEIVTRFHNKDAGISANDYFNRTVRQKQYEEKSIDYIMSNSSISIVDMISKIGCESKSQVRRLIKQGGIRINGEVIFSEYNISTQMGDLSLGIGKRRNYKVKIKE